MKTIKRFSQILVIAVGCVPLLAACAKQSVPVSMHGVNYSANDFSYFLVDPKNKANQGGGEEIAPFAAGGTVCCYEIPAKWNPGLKVEIRATHWVHSTMDGKLQEIKKNVIVSIPKYSEPAEMWVISGTDGALSLIASNVQPNHEKWPGKVKGWPVPSLEYQRSRWDLYIKDAREGVELYESFLNGMKKDPLGEAKEAWDYAVTREGKPPTGFSSYKDPAYIRSLTDEYNASLLVQRKKLQKFLDSRP